MIKKLSKWKHALNTWVTSGQMKPNTTDNATVLTYKIQNTKKQIVHTHYSVEHKCISPSMWLVNADTLIVQKALDIAKTGENVNVIANATAGLVMLVHHFEFDSEIHTDIFYVGTVEISICLLCAVLGKSMCAWLPCVPICTCIIWMWDYLCHVWHWEG